MLPFFTPCNGAKYNAECQYEQANVPDKHVRVSPWPHRVYGHEVGNNSGQCNGCKKCRRHGVSVQHQCHANNDLCNANSLHRMCER